MFNNLSGKQGFLFGIISGGGIMAIAGFSIASALLFTKQTTAMQPSQTNTQPAVAAAQNTNATPAATPANIPKSDKPKAELFVMSYCPYGMDMEQNAFIPAYSLLKDKADISVKFVSYAMHGKQEVEENTRQYCAQEQDKDKYFTYLNCFNESGNSASCLQKAGLDEKKLNNCVSDTNKKYAIMDKFNDQSTWLNGNYPVYPIDEELNNAYGVQGSPTLVINGTQVSADRTANGVAAAICAGFNNAPAECDQFLAQAATVQPALAMNQNAKGACGG